MLRHLGSVAANHTIDASTARTCRLANATPDRLRALIAANLADLERVFAFSPVRPNGRGQEEGPRAAPVPGASRDDGGSGLKSRVAGADDRDGIVRFDPVTHLRRVIAS